MPMNAAKLLLLNVLGGGSAAAPFSPADIAGLALWLDASDASTLFQNSNGTTAAAADADPVGYWGDKSGNGRNATQGTAGARPLLKTAIQNGKNVLRFDGAGDLMRSDAIAALVAGTDVPFTVFAVFRMDSVPASNAGIYCLSDGTTSLLHRVSWKSGTNKFFRRSDVDRVNDPALTAGAHVLSDQFTGTLRSAYDNGTALFTNADFDTGATAFTQFAIGAALVASETLTGDLAEVLIVTGTPSDTVRLQVESYLIAKWGVSP